MMERVFGWIWVALGVTGIVAVAVGAYWHGFTVGVCAVMAWCCFHEAHEEGIKKGQRTHRANLRT